MPITAEVIGVRDEAGQPPSRSRPYLYFQLAAITPSKVSP